MNRTTFLVVAGIGLIVAVSVLGLLRQPEGGEPPSGGAPQPAAVSLPAASGGPVSGGAGSEPAAPDRVSPAVPGAGQVDVAGAAPPARQRVEPVPVEVPPVAGVAEAQDAQAVLRRVAEVYARVNSLQAEFVQQLDNRLLDRRFDGRGMLYQRQPDRFLMRFSEPAGDIIVSDGTYFWIYYPSVDARQVMRARVADVGAGAVDLRAQFLGDPTERFHYTLEGREAVAGRQAWVLNLVPRQRAEFQSLRVWVDERDHLVRRFEITESEAVVRRLELQDLRIDPQLSDELFRFEPPPGVRVIDVG